MNEKDVSRKDLINTMYDISKLIDNQRSKNISCPNPSHVDKSPSAHVYEDGNVIWCFTCKKPFTVLDLALWENISIGDIYKELLFDFGGKENLLEEYEKVYNKIQERKKQEGTKPVRKRNEEYIDFTKRYFGEL